MRSRSTSAGSLFGNVQRFYEDGGGHIDTTSIDLLPTSVDTVTDDGGPSGSHYFFTEHTRLVNLAGIFYSYTYDGIRYELNNYLPGPVQDLLQVRHLISPYLDSPTSGGDWAVELLKRTNPSRPSISLPTFFGESLQDVKELPQTIKTKGETYASSLGIRFGILPLISDIRKMVNLSESVDKRSRELVRLNDKGGARVKRTLQKITANAVVSHPAGAGSDRDQYLQGRVETTTRSTVWGVTHWVPDSGFNTVIRGETVNRAELKKILLGISSDENLQARARDAWNLIPFSWLSDWFSNFGDLLAATANDNLAHPVNTCIMQELITTRTFVCAQGRFTLEKVTRSRSYPPYLQLAWSSPILSGDQLLILSGLAERHPRSGAAFGRSGGGLPPIG